MMHIRLKDSKSQSHITMKKYTDMLLIKATGSADAEAILEYLPIMIHSLPASSILRIDFSNAKNLDHLAISSLVVILRKHGGSFTNIQLRGLEDWMLLRLKGDGFDAILGPQWMVAYGDDWLELDKKSVLDKKRKRQAPQPARQAVRQISA